MEIDPVWAAFGCLFLMLALLIIGVPVGLSLGLCGALGFFLSSGWDGALSQIQNLPYSITAQYVFAVVPMFVLMGNLAVTGGLAKDLYVAADKWFGHMRGGLYLSTIFGSTAFGAASGSTVVNSTVFTRIALPEMLRLGYSRSMAGACIAAVGTIDAMIPPSIAMVIYGIICEVSIGKLFMAGIIPGIMTMVAFVLLVMVMVRLKPELAPVREEKASLNERFSALGPTWAVALVFGLVMAGIYFGVFAPSAAGAAGAAATFLLVLVRRRVSARSLWSDLEDAALITALLFVIIIGGMLFSRMLLQSGLVTFLVDSVQGMGLSALQLILMFSLMYLILGCFLDSVSMMVVTLPFVYPIIRVAGVEPVWFGIIIVQLVEIGMITPPIGLNLFATVSAAKGDVTMSDLIAGIAPFVVVSALVWALIVAFPMLALWLPNTMFGK